LAPSGNGYTENVVYSFSGFPNDGANVGGGLVRDKNGNLFGITAAGGTTGSGTVFELTYVLGVGWKEQVLYNFEGGTDGVSPSAGLIFDSAGNLYGTTYGGGIGNGGTVFELSPSGDIWIHKLLYTFTGQGSYCGPLAALAMDGAGNLYGTTWCDGIYGYGNVFKLSKSQNGWAYTSLYDFTGTTEGSLAASNVAIDADGTLYGTAWSGGHMNSCNNGGCGVVWMIKP
jgi:uncharacterized repeat protein (TIGR03803 family)